MFIDEVKIKVIAGSGGDGCTAFRREKFVPMGGPFGGNGGHGSNIVFQVDTGLHTLVDLHYMKTIKGHKGENGLGKNQTGKSSEDVVIKVPQGTIVTDLDTGLIIADLKEKDDRVIVAAGGRGGRGNTAFKTLSNPCPTFSENGEPGEEKLLKVELKLLADAGLVGLPSVGKSTFLSKVTAAKPKIADYHFTTLSPNLGVCKTSDNRSFVIADLPGLIEGASEGLGLGDKFLRHIERCKVIVHIIDMAGTEGRNPYDDYVLINKELEKYSKKLVNKPMIVLANKMDMEESKKNLEEFKKKVKCEVYAISAIKGENLDKALIKIADLIDKSVDDELYEEDKYLSHVLYKFENERPYTIEKVDDYFVIHGEEIEKLFRMTKFESEESILRFARHLRKMGIDDELEKMGAKEGDLVKILDYNFEYRK